MEVSIPNASIRYPYPSVHSELSHQFVWRAHLSVKKEATHGRVEGTTYPFQITRVEAKLGHSLLSLFGTRPDLIVYSLSVYRDKLHSHDPIGSRVSISSMSGRVSIHSCLGSTEDPFRQQGFELGKEIYSQGSLESFVLFPGFRIVKMVARNIGVATGVYFITL